MRGNTFHGPAAVQLGDGGTQHVRFVYEGDSSSSYRIQDFPTGPRQVRGRTLATQPSRLLWAAHQVVPFTGREDVLADLASWRDDPDERFMVRLVHGPGGQGKTRLAARFAHLSREAEAGWTVWQAAVTDNDVSTTSPTSPAGAGLLLIVDYAERWPVPALRALLQDPALRTLAGPVRVLLLARSAGVWWDSLENWIDTTFDAPAEAHRLPPLAQDTSARAALFHQARNRFAHCLGLPPDRGDDIAPPADLDSDADYAQVLTIHIAALAAVDARLHDDRPPTGPAHASAYLLTRERAYWTALHERTPGPLATSPKAMGRCVLTAALTGPVSRAHGWDALRRGGLADTRESANTLLDDHQTCYPPVHPTTVLEPLYPDRLAEDYLGLTIPPPADHDDEPVPGAKPDDWADQAVRALLAPDAEGGAPAPWVRDALTVLIETARRWPHVATGQLYPLLRAHPELAMHAGGAALAALAGLDHIDLAALEAIESRFPKGRHTDLDIGIAAVTARLARHRLATTRDPAVRALIHDILAARQFHAGLRDEAAMAGREAVKVWRNLTPTQPVHQPDLALSLSNLGVTLSELGLSEEAVSATAEAVEVFRGLAAGDATAFEVGLAQSLSNLGVALSKAGRREEALTADEEAVGAYRRLAARDAAAFEADLARSLSNLGVGLSQVGCREEGLAAEQEAVEIRRRLAACHAAAFEPGLADSLSNLGVRLSEVGRPEEALSATVEGVEVYRRLAAGNAPLFEPDLAGSLSNLGIRLSRVGRREEGLAAEQEAVKIRRRLAAGNVAAFEPALAHSLSNLGVRLSEVGRPEEALSATVEALGIRRRLAAGNAALFEPDLAESLTNLGFVLMNGQRRGEALSVVDEAVAVYRHLAADHPAAFAPYLADSLILWASAQQDLYAALRATGEAVEIYRGLVAAGPSPHVAAQLREALGVQARLLFSCGRVAEAMSILKWLAAHE